MQKDSPAFADCMVGQVQLTMQATTPKLFSFEDFSATIFQSFLYF
jgi:hypothetical protein